MYQHMRLYEFAGSMKLLLTGFILAICAAGILGIVAFYHACKDADGGPAVSFEDIKIFIRGARHSVLEAAAENPEDFDLRDAGALDLNLLRTWCHAGAPRENFREIADILKDSAFDRARRPDGAGANVGRDSDEEYQRIKAFAQRHEPLSAVRLLTGTSLYLSIVALAFLSLGMLFARTSLFEKTKVLFIGATFALAVTGPLCLWLVRTHAAFIYPMLLSALLLIVCFGVLALVALYDIWFRRTVT